MTGAGGALGAAVTAAFADQSDHVVAVDRSDDALQAVDDRADREFADLTDPALVDTLFDRITAAHGGFDVVVHTVGAFRPGGIVGSTPQDYRMLLDVNLSTAWWVSRAAAGRMQPAGHGTIIHIGARNGAAAYGVTKAALVQLTRVLDAELRGHGVRVNTVVPGLIDTPANRAMLPAETMTRAVTPAAIARIITFLAGPTAAPVGGAVIPVYGTG